MVLLWDIPRASRGVSFCRNAVAAQAKGGTVQRDIIKEDIIGYLRIIQVRVGPSEDELTAMPCKYIETRPISV